LRRESLINTSRRLSRFPKRLICAVNGVGVGKGATGKCPFCGADGTGKLMPGRWRISLPGEVIDQLKTRW
jgi:hypothetical protein